MSVPDPATTDWVPLAVGGAIDYVGAWNAGTAYLPGHIVRHNGIDYIAVNPSTGQAPDPGSFGRPSAWTTGDEKISAQSASHDDPSGGRWLLADGVAIPGQYTALIALIGPNMPDARGRGLVMKGTHADVDAIGDSDGIALASRSPKHKSSIIDPGHFHTYSAPAGSTAQGSSAPAPNTSAPTSTDTKTTGISVGPAASAMIDTGSFVVVGNLFIHT